MSPITSVLFSGPAQPATRIPVMSVRSTTQNVLLPAFINLLLVNLPWRLCRDRRSRVSVGSFYPMAGVSVFVLSEDGTLRCIAQPEVVGRAGDTLRSSPDRQNRQIALPSAA